MFRVFTRRLRTHRGLQHRPPQAGGPHLHLRKKDFVVGDDGHYRLYVTVPGDRVGSFSEYLKIPETFSREYREIRTRAGLLTKVAGDLPLPWPLP